MKNRISFIPLYSEGTVVYMKNDLDQLPHVVCGFSVSNGGKSVNYLLYNSDGVTISAQGCLLSTVYSEEVVTKYNNLDSESI